MIRSVVWVIGNSGWNPGALTVRWASVWLARAGIAVTVQPLGPPGGPPLSWGPDLVVNTPISASKARWGRAQRRILGQRLALYDRIVCDQDFSCEFRVLDVLQSQTPAYLWARQPELPPDPRPYSRFDGIFTPSRNAHRAFAEKALVLPSRLWHLPLLVDWAPDEMPGESHELVAAGVVEPVKGLEVLFNALTVLRDRGRRLSVTVLGDGPDAPRLQSYAAALGVAARFIPQPVGWGAHIRHADLLVAPQFQDGLAFDVDAALAVGTPVVATNLPVIRERVGPTPLARLMDEPTVMNVVELLQLPWPKRQAGANASPDRLHLWLQALMAAD